MRYWKLSGTNFRNKGNGMDSFKSEWIKQFDDYWANMHPVKRFCIRKIEHPVKRFISYVRYDIHQGFYGLYYWGKFAWTWRPWDWACGVRALELHLKALEPCLRNGSSESGPKTADEVKQALFLIKRILEDDYPLDNKADCLSEKQNFQNAIHGPSRDLTQLTQLLDKKLMRWWN